MRYRRAASSADAAFLLGFVIVRRRGHVEPEASRMRFLLFLRRLRRLRHGAQAVHSRHHTLHFSGRFLL
jgi:hypothetical protein